MLSTVSHGSEEFLFKKNMLKFVAANIETSILKCRFFCSFFFLFFFLFYLLFTFSLIIICTGHKRPAFFTSSKTPVRSFLHQSFCFMPNTAFLQCNHICCVKKKKKGNRFNNISDSVVSKCIKARRSCKEIKSDDI